MFSIFLSLSFFNVGLLNFSIKGLTNVNTDIATDDNSTDSPQNENSKFTPENTTTASTIKVGEIWDDTNKKFDSTELTKLMRYASNTNVTVSDISEINTLLTGDKKVNANDMRGFNSNKDIIVKLGGLEWTVTYLSKDKNGNPILTLWLANSTQLASKSVYSNGGNATATPIRTIFNSNATTTWNSGFSPSDTPNSNYPDTMYGTSYIRSVVLNNGGWYTTSTGGGSGLSFTKKTDSIFSPFTITTSNKSALSDFLIAPMNVGWQEFESVKTQLKWGFDSSNDGWGKVTNNSTYYNNGVYNYSNKTNYDVWKNDLLWIPSAVEIGYRSNNNGIGYCYTSSNQRTNSCHSWSRSVVNVSAKEAIVFYASGENVDYEHNTLINLSYAVRPALHLNLDLASKNASKDLWGSLKFDMLNLNSVLKYIAGKDTLTTNSALMTDINRQINASADKVLYASDIKTNANRITDKTRLSVDGELVIELGGLRWYAVYLSKRYEISKDIYLTLYLTDSGQLYNLNYINSSGVVTKFNQYGSASWNGGGSPYISGNDEYPIYSSSYMRQNILNNKYDLENTQYSLSSVFASFTTTSFEQSAIGDFILPPCEQTWQNEQSAKAKLGFRFNLINESPTNLEKLSPTYSFLSQASSGIDFSLDSLFQNDKVGGVILSASEESIPMTLNAPIMYSATGTADTQTTLITSNELSKITYSAVANYDLWKYDRLWLPSLTETGGGEKVGLWKLSNAQRKNTNGTASWLRSGHITDKNSVYTLTADGTNYGYTAVNTQNGIRPALHLNLTLACANAV